MRFSVVFILLAVVFLGSCRKDPNPNVDRFRILKEREQVSTSLDRVSVSGIYDYSGAVDDMLFRLGTDSHLHGSKDYEVMLNANTYSVTVDNLQAGTLYYYAYVVDLGAAEHVTEIDSFTTLSGAPEVETLGVLVIDSLEVRVKCKVLHDGGVEVTERGVCWNDYGDPTVDDALMAYPEGGTGEYTCLLTDLQPLTSYYVRAYAKNESGLSYGEVLEFNTGEEVNLPAVVTIEVAGVTTTTATCMCHVADDGGAEIIERGACWSTDDNPNVMNFIYANGGGVGNYSVPLVDLHAHTRYYVRAYAKNSKGIGYGEVVSFLTMDYLNPPLGAVNGVFTVAEGRQVWFSQSNLQYRASTNQWRFAEELNEYIGLSNANIAEDYDGWIDLFGWGTSGYPHGAVCYQPWSSEENLECYWAYGAEAYQLYDQTGQADWGYNIINGEGPEGQWRTLTSEEWSYLFFERNTGSGIRFAKAQVEGVNGVLLLPDQWSTAVHYLNNVNQEGASFSSNVMTLMTLDILNSQGVAFLPAAGRRDGTVVDYPGSRGYYYSSSCVGRWARGMAFDYNSLSTSQTITRSIGCSVRLVQDVARR
ncbi:MAG: hypothetical protein K5920_09085 [Bacteroidales bacterium]|nr:hypothetical protein [Bacteroidales bacterium]